MSANTCFVAHTFSDLYYILQSSYSMLAGQSFYREVPGSSDLQSPCALQAVGKETALQGGPEQLRVVLEVARTTAL